jgi:hypothetical protein
MDQSEKLKKVLTDYAVPDPKIVSKLPKGGVTLDYVSHADITRILLEVDSHWTIEPVALDEAGLPARTKVGNMVQAGFWMTLLGHRRYCVGSVEDRKADQAKELVSDAIRNGAMRYGVALSLWTKNEWEDLTHTPAPAPAPKQATKPVVKPVSKETVIKFIEACSNENLDHDKVADHAGVDLAGPINTDDLSKLRESFKHLKGNT